MKLTYRELEKVTAGAGQIPTTKTAAHKKHTANSCIFNYSTYFSCCYATATRFF